MSTVDEQKTSALLTNEQRNEYTQAFSLFDRDDDGLINVKELSLLIRSLECNPTDLEIQQLIDPIVDQGNNLIDCNQFLSIMSILEKSRDSNERKEIRQIFDSIDTDGNGLIDTEELRIAMRSFSSTNDEMKLTKEEINEMIAEFDQDKDRRLTFEEFVNLFMEQF